MYHAVVLLYSVAHIVGYGYTILYLTLLLL